MCRPIVGLIADTRTIKLKKNRTQIMRNIYENRQFSL